MLHVRQIVQRDLLRMEFVDVADYAADTVDGDLVSGFEIDYDVVIESEEVEVFIHVFDNVHHHIGALGFVVESSGGILKKYLQKLLP